MFLVNAETEILWELDPTNSPLLVTDFDLVITDPLGLITYLNSPIEVSRYTAPTDVLPGSVSYLFTPTLEGLWKVNLATGTSINYTVLSKTELFVFDNSLTVNPIKNTPLGVNGAIEVADILGLVTSQATKLVFYGNEFTVNELNDVVTISIGDYPVAPYTSTADLLSALTGAITDSNLTTSLQARISLIDGIQIGSVNDRIQTEVLDRTSADAVIDARVTALDVSTSNSLASIDTELLVLSDTDVSLAAATTGLTTTVDGNTASLITHSSSINGLELQYTVKVDNNGYVAGFGLASTLRDSTPFSEFTILADKFTIAASATSPDLDASAPFFHLTAATLIDGVTVPPGTYMKTAYIADATITNAKIGNLIESSGADPVNGTGWRITKDGSIEASAITIRDSSGNLILDANGNYSVDIDNAFAPGDDTLVELEAGVAITSGGITLSAGGSLKSTGLTNENVDATAGVWLGWNGSDYTFGVGDGGYQYIKYDGNTLSIGPETKVLGVDSVNNDVIYWHSWMTVLDEFNTSNCFRTLHNYGIEVQGDGASGGSLYFDRDNQIIEGSWGKNRAWKAGIRWNSQSDMNGVNFIGMGYINTSFPSVGFEFVRSGTVIYVYPRTKSTIGGSVHAYGAGASSMYNFSAATSVGMSLKVEVIPGLKVKYYINGVLMYTHSTASSIPRAGDSEATTFLYVSVPQLAAAGVCELFVNEVVFYQNE